jgi:hypothetical protein
MKSAIEMGSGAMIYIPSFVKLVKTLKHLWGDTQTHRQHGNRISLLFFYKIMKMG